MGMPMIVAARLAGNGFQPIFPGFEQALPYDRCGSTFHRIEFDGSAEYNLLSAIALAAMPAIGIGE